jgi:hypothetical protein
MTTSIEHAYLMWVGAEHYGTMGEWIDEALIQGISKRLPNAAIGATLMKPGTVIFVAHANGEYEPCPKCLGEVECPECRKRQNESKKIISDAEAIKDNAKAYARARKRATRLLDACTDCLECDGEFSSRAGTGGSVTLMTDSVHTEHWDYRRYNYWLHQPSKWQPKDVISLDMCSHCGGTGRRPAGKVYGVFVPSAVEYILPEGSDAKIKAEMEARSFRTVSLSALKLEPRRKCGTRKPGGTYVVASTSTHTNVQAIIKDLVRTGRIEADGVEINGGLIRFINPIEIESKAFRGIRRWGLDPRAEAEAEMILEAM